MRKEKADLHIKIDSEKKEKLKDMGINISEKVNEFAGYLIERYGGDGLRYDLVSRYMDLQDKVEEIEEEKEELESRFKKMFEGDIEDHTDEEIVEKIVDKSRSRRDKLLDKFIENHGSFMESRSSKYEGEPDYLEEVMMFEALLKKYDYTGRDEDFLREAYERKKKKNEVE